MKAFNLAIWIALVFLLAGCVEQSIENQGEPSGAEAVHIKSEQVTQPDILASTLGRPKYNIEVITNIIEIEKGTDVSSLSLPSGTEWRVKEKRPKIVKDPSRSRNTDKLVVIDWPTIFYALPVEPQPPKAGATLFRLDSGGDDQYRLTFENREGQIYTFPYLSN